MKHLVSLDFFADFVQKLESYTQNFDVYLSETGHLKAISMILMLLALVLFLVLIIVLYIRSIVRFLKGNNPAKNLRDDSAFDAEDEFFEEEQQELERELQKELDLALAARNLEEKETNQNQKQKKEKEALAEETKKEKTAESKKTKELSKNSEIGFDWQKGKFPPSELGALETAETLSYKQNKKELNQLIGLVIDMLGRGVDDLKIAQTLNFKMQGMTEENEILKAIDAVKSFINLCLSAKFVNLKQYKNLPKENLALYHLANGDSSLALALMENLMDTEIDRANACSSEEKRQRIYSEVSTYACCFGALSEMNDTLLATSAYELAIELQSSNVTAWGRLGDVCLRANSPSKAVWAYQNVLNFADEEIDVSQIANANKHLSEQLYSEGKSLQAAKLYNASKQYYNSLGINRRLDKQEIEIIGIIESNYKQSLQETIQKLLSAEKQNA